MLFNAKNEWDFRLKCPNRPSTILKCKKVLLFSSRSFVTYCLAQKWKTKSPFLYLLGNKASIHIETQPLPRTQKVWTDHQVPLTWASNQLSGRYSKWDAAGRLSRGPSQPGLLEEESQGQGRGPEGLLWLFPSRISTKQYRFWLLKAAWANFCPEWHQIISKLPPDCKSLWLYNTPLREPSHLAFNFDL